jgi:hypothetical protein
MILIWAGLLAGAVHVVSGPDHLLALAPFSIQSDQSKTWIGIKWGLGHGIGIACVAIGLLFVKTQIDVVQVSEWAELMVGFVLIAVGVKALFMARKLVIHDHDHAHDHGHFSNGHQHQHSHLHVHVGESRHPHPSTDKAHLHAPMWIGLLHGVAGTGHLFGLVPALGLGLGDAGIYLTAYVIASIATMVMCVSCLDAVVARAGAHMMPRIMKWTASAAIITGIVWLYNNGYSTGRLLDIGS